MKPKLRFQRVASEACIPEKKTKDAAGYDLRSTHRVVIKPKQRATIGTGLILGIPNGYYGRLASRSGLAANHCIDVEAGVIDSDYRGEVQSVLSNNGDKDFVIEVGQRMCQLILEKIGSDVNIEECDDLIGEKTLRGTNGFGSTGRI